MSRVGEWKITTDQTAEIYLVAADVLHSASRNQDEMSFLHKYLALYGDADAAKPAVQAVAKRIALLAISSRDCFQYDHLQELAGVRALAQCMFSIAAPRPMGCAACGAWGSRARS